MNIIIDAGHGGSDNGCKAFDGTPEKYYNLILAKNVYKILSQYANTYMLRYEDIYFDLGDRSRFSKKISEEIGKTYLFSFHFNAYNQRAKGIEIFTSQYGTKNKEFATFLCYEFSKKFNLINRGQKTRINNNGDDYYSIHRQTEKEVTAFIVETCFIDNQDDFNFISQKGMLDKIATFYAKHILKQLFNITMLEKPDNSLEIEILIDKLNIANEKIEKQKFDISKLRKELEINSEILQKIRDLL